MYPYHLGYEIADFSTSLLYHGSLLVGIPGWVSQRPVEVFDHVLRWVEHSQSDWLPTFEMVKTALMEAWRHGAVAAHVLEPLEGRVKKLTFVGSGTIETYEEISKLDVSSEIRSQIASELRVPAWRHIAATEFVWRVYELSLELSGDPEIILHHLRSTQSSPEQVLVDCLLHRLTSFGDGGGCLSTNSQTAVNVLQSIEQRVAGQEDDDSSCRIDNLAMYFFETLTAPYAPPLAPPFISQIAQLIENRQGELDSLRAKCHREAEHLVYDASRFQADDGAIVESRVKEALAVMVEEVSGIAHVNSTTASAIVTQMAEDSTVWMMVLGFIGSRVAGLPGVVPASLAVALLSKAGSLSVKELRSRYQTLRKSSWAGIYFMSRIAPSHRDLWECNATKN